MARKKSKKAPTVKTRSDWPTPGEVEMVAEVFVASEEAAKPHDHVPGPTPVDLKASFPQHDVSSTSTFAPVPEELGPNIPDQQVEESNRRAADFMSRYRERNVESKTKAAFIEFFDLAAKLNESAHGLGIRGATLDADSGEVTVTFKTRQDTAPATT